MQIIEGTGNLIPLAEMVKKIGYMLVSVSVSVRLDTG